MALVLFSLSSTAQNIPFTEASRIVTGGNTPEMKTATDILRRFMQEATGYTFDPASTPHKGDIRLKEVKGLPEDSFRVGVHGGAVVLEGSGKSLIYAVCDFLEQEMGMDYWGDGEYSLPRKKAVTVRPRTEVPAFRYRQTSHYSLRNGRVATSDNGVNREHRADSLYRYWYRLEEPHELFVDNLWVHTCNKLLPASRYGEKHPEYYAYFGGKRHPGSASQWCMSNPEVFEIVCGALDSLFHAYPGSR